jgi:hypothetical protein
MTLRPDTLPDWATDLNLTDPPEAWDGTPSKVDPGAGKRAQGWNPNEEHPAQNENYHQNLIGRFVRHFDRLRLAEFDNFIQSLPDLRNGIPDAQFFQCFEAVYFPSTDGQPLWLVTGEGQAVLGDGYLLRGGDDCNDFEVSQPYGAVHDPRSIDYDAANDILIVTGDVASGTSIIERSANVGDSFTQPGSPWVAGSSGFHVATDGAGDWVITGDDNVAASDADGGAAIMSSTDNGATWTNRTNSTGLILQQPRFGNSLWVVVGNGVVLTSTDAIAFTSQTPPANFRGFDVLYNAAAGRWYAVGDETGGSGRGEIWSNDDPINNAWVNEITDTSGVESHLNAIAQDEDGNMIAVGWAENGASPNIRSGIHYVSLDQGTTWQLLGNGMNMRTGNSRRWPRVRYGGGRFAFPGAKTQGDGIIGPEVWRSIKAIR